MIKKIQNYLLLNHPLLWNIKFVPVFAIGIIINLLFWIGGYIYGKIDFQEYNDSYNYYDSTPSLVIMLSVIVTLIVLTLWIVFYIRNNAFKSLYPKTKISLFTEWGLICLLCIINSSFFSSFSYGCEVRARQYFTEQELNQRLKIISQASIFSDGSYERNQDTVINRQTYKRTSFIYSGKKYKLNSLLNKIPESFSVTGDRNDSINTKKVRSWLVENKKDSVYAVMDKFLKLTAEHGLHGNITAKQWLDLVYHYPDFTAYMVIGNDNLNPVYPYYEDSNFNPDVMDAPYLDETDSQRPIDFTMNVKKIVNGKIQVYPKYHVPMSQVKVAYGKMSKAWTAPDADWRTLMVLAYIGIIISTLVFSFRVTSGKSWLISGISMAIALVVTGLITAFLSSYIRYTMSSANYENYFIAIWTAIILTVLLYYIIRLGKKSKGISGIAVNILSWTLPLLIPALYALSTKIARSLNTEYFKNGEYIVIEHPVYKWLNQHYELMLSLNIAIIVLYMYFFTISIKRWKGIAEG